MQLQLILLVLLPLAAFAYDFDKYISGPITDFEKRTWRSICDDDDSQEAKCYMDSHPTVYETSKAVLRIVRSDGAGHCTGWLVGSEGHVLTNYHCIGSQSEANSLYFQAMSESPQCSPGCATNGGCAGTTIHSEPLEFIDTGGSIQDDYTLLKLRSTENLQSILDTYGYLQIRASGPVVGEEIYITQHPAGWAKRIAMLHGSENATIISTTLSAGCGSNQVAYKADTQGGSSGSPVLGKSDNAVVAIHHCGGCSDNGNTGVNGQDIYDAFRGQLPENAFV